MKCIGKAGKRTGKRTRRIHSSTNNGAHNTVLRDVLQNAYQTLVKWQIVHVYDNGFYISNNHIVFTHELIVWMEHCKNVLVCKVEIYRGNENEEKKFFFAVAFWTIVYVSVNCCVSMRMIWLCSISMRLKLWYVFNTIANTR